MTSLPASHFRFGRRGVIREGWAADLVIFDPARVTDAATFERPHAYAAGIPYVVVNGIPVVRQGKHTAREARAARLHGKGIALTGDDAPPHLPSSFGCSAAGDAAASAPEGPRRRRRRRRVRRVDGAEPAETRRASHAGRWLGPGQFTRELGRRDARHPRRLRIEPDVRRPREPRVRALARARTGGGPAALHRDWRAVARRIAGRRPGALVDATPAGRGAAVQRAERRRGDEALSADRVRRNPLGAPGAEGWLPARPPRL